MPLSVSALHRQLLDTTLTRSFDNAFRGLVTRDPALAGFADLAALMAHQHGRFADAWQKNGVLRSLVAAAQDCGHSGSDAAVTSLLLALWPGLDAVHGRLRHRFAHDHDDLTADILARAVEAVRTLDLDRVVWVAATVTRNIERDVVRHRLRAARTVEPDLTAAVSDAEDRVLARQIVAVLGRDAGLVLAVAVDGENQTAAGAALGLEPSAARKRYGRALARARTAL